MSSLDIQSRLAPGARAQAERAKKVATSAALLVLAALFVGLFHLHPHLIADTGPNARPSVPLTSQVMLVQEVDPSGAAQVSSFDILLATGGRPFNSAAAALRVWSRESGKLFEQPLPPGSVADNAWMHFVLPRPARVSRADPLYVVLSCKTDTTDNGITAWTNSNTSAVGSLYVLTAKAIGATGLPGALRGATAEESTLCMRVYGLGPRAVLAETLAHVGVALLCTLLVVLLWTWGWLLRSHPNLVSGARDHAAAVGRAWSRVPRSWFWSLAAVLIYGALGLAANWPALPGNPSLTRAGDPWLMEWYLSWWPHAIAHGWNPFFTTVMNYPDGINLAGNTSMPLLSLLFSPLTMTAGVVASLNLLNWLTFPACASAMYFVLRRWTKWPLAAFVGGALYGFSAHVVGQGLGHLDIAFVPLPPLMLLCAYELFVRQKGSSKRWGLALGLLVIAQVFIAQEVAVTTLLVVLLAAVLLALNHPSHVVAHAKWALPGLLLGVVLTAVAVAYPFWAAVAGPYHYSGPAHYGGLSADLLGTFVPTSMQRFAPASWIALGSKLVAGNVPENGSYLGIPLVLLLAFLMVRFRRDRWILFSAVMLVATWVLSLGARVTISGKATAVPGPWAIFQHMPLLESLLSVRMTLFVALFASLALARGLDNYRPDASSGRRDASGARSHQRSRPTKLEGWAVAVVCLAAVLLLVPRWPYPGTVPAGVPPYFSSSAVEQIPLGSVVLISPYPSVMDPQTLLWQAVAGDRFKMIGGYAQFRDSSGGSTNFPAVLVPRQVESYLWSQVASGPAFPDPSVPVFNEKLVRQFRGFLTRYRVNAVLYTPVGPDSANVLHLFEAALGRPSTTSGGVTAWYRVQGRNMKSDTPLP